MRVVMWIRQYVFVPVFLMLCACSTTGEEYADVMEQKIAQVQLEDKEPITTLAFVETKKTKELDIRIVREETAPQDIETAAGDGQAVSTEEVN